GSAGGFAQPLSSAVIANVARMAEPARRSLLTCVSLPLLWTIQSDSRQGRCHHSGLPRGVHGTHLARIWSPQDKIRRSFTQLVVKGRSHLLKGFSLGNCVLIAGMFMSHARRSSVEGQSRSDAVTPRAASRALSRLRAADSICRTRSRVTPSRRPMLS